MGVSFCLELILMNMYVNLCTAYAEKSETLTLDVPPDQMDTCLLYTSDAADE